jgi:muramoyltetrapeptide carboxypeptidase
MKTDLVAPPRLAKGDRVAVIAPAGPVPPDAFEAGVARLRQRYHVEYDGDVLSRDGFLAGSDERRTKEIERWLNEKDVRALFCARGGYGITRILPRLDAAALALAKSPKVIVGFSDSTALLQWALGAGVRAVHGPVISQLGKLPQEDVNALWSLLEYPDPPPPIGGIGASKTQSFFGKISGRLVGGNLEVLTRLVGTRWQPEWSGCVLLLEEIGERPYRIDRQLTHLQQAGMLENLAAVVVGDLVRCTEPADAWPGQPSPTAIEVIRERCVSYGVPVFTGLPVGHGERNRALPLGARVAIDPMKGQLVPLEGAVS